jgi:hypothetical protein
VSDRARELAERNATLRLRCAFQRRAVVSEVRAIEARLQPIDRALTFARGTVLQPIIIVTGIVGLVVVARLRGAGTFRLISRGLLLAAAARRFLRLLRKF